MSGIKFMDNVFNFGDRRSFHDLVNTQGSRISGLVFGRPISAGSAFDIFDQSYFYVISELVGQIISLAYEIQFARRNVHSLSLPFTTDTCNHIYGQRYVSGERYI